MAIMNKAGVFLYNLGLLLTLGILFLCFKNYNIENPSDTLDYTNSMKMMIFVMLGIYYAFALGLMLASFFSRARKKGFIFSVLAIWFLVMIIGSVLFAFLPDIISSEYTYPGIRFFIIPVSIGIAFIPAFLLMLLMFPGSVDRKYLVKEVAKKLKAAEKRSKQFCPKCKYPTEKEWKHCPRCGAHFSD
ncbi:MAG: zinc ribbon domain-containing protein [Candidatus Thermoplasmatota archaeon]|nr:zinc ribbon domain-containing protein [Candidatus Thermoplasmatota archaeon]